MKKYIYIAAAIFIVAGIFAAIRFSAPADDELFLYCGAGMRPEVARVVELFTAETGIPVRVDYNASNLLLGRIKVSRTGDLFMPGDIHYIGLAEEEGLIKESRQVASFVPVIMVAQGNPENIQSIADLTDAGIKLGLADSRTAAIGRISRMIFKKNGIPDEAFEKNLIYDSVTVNDLANAIELGHIDATIVWEPVARRIADAGIVKIPAERNVAAPVPIAVLSVSQQQENARRFVEFILSEPGQAVFKQSHYGSRKDFDHE